VDPYLPTDSLSQGEQDNPPRYSAVVVLPTPPFSFVMQKAFVIVMVYWYTSKMV